MIKFNGIHVFPDGSVFINANFYETPYSVAIFSSKESIGLYNLEKEKMLIHDEDGFKWIPIDFAIHDNFYKCPEVVKKLMKIKVADLMVDDKKGDYLRTFVENLIKQSDSDFDED